MQIFSVIHSEIWLDVCNSEFCTEFFVPYSIQFHQLLFFDYKSSVGFQNLIWWNFLLKISFTTRGVRRLTALGVEAVVCLVVKHKGAE